MKRVKVIFLRRKWWAAAGCLAAAVLILCVVNHPAVVGASAATRQPVSYTHLLTQADSGCKTASDQVFPRYGVYSQGDTIFPAQWEKVYRRTSRLELSKEGTDK